MIRRLHTFIMVITAMLLASIAVPVLAQELIWTGTGTQDAPYQVDSKEKLAAIASGLDKHYKLTQDIPLTDKWTPLGAFTGSLDGNGFTISGLNVSVESDAGLFATIGTSENPTGIVKNLGVIGSVTSKCTSQYAGNSAGGIASKNYGTIQNCYTSVTVTCNPTNDMCNAGGIAGSNHGTIQNCYTTEAVTNEKGQAGGIAGENSSAQGRAVIQYCYATGDIKGNQAGGITGENNDGKVQNCIALNSSITGTGTDPKVGRIAGVHGGYLGAQKLADNHAALSIPGTWAAADKDAGKKNGADLTEDTFTEKGVNAGAFIGWTAANWDFTTTPNLPTLQGFKTDQPVKDKERAPFLEVPVTTITDQAGLAAIKDNLSGSYKLGNDITLTYVEGETWKPLGEFTGTLDGDGYVISGLKVSVTEKAGLFEAIGKNGIVKNLGVTGESVTSTNAYINGPAGGIAGYSEGTIQNCYTSVAVTASNSADGAGGIVGNNAGTILNCYTTGAITNSGSAGSAGGIAGKNTDSNASIQYCYATGAIKGITVGGIIGYNSSAKTVSYCIALNASITGTSSIIGRIVGAGDSGTANHAALSIPGVWADKGADKKNGADLTEDTFTEKGVNAGAFIGWTAANWDFTTTPNLPTLQGFKTDQPVKDKERAPFLEVPVTTITKQEELAAIKDNLAGSYKLGGNIILSGDWTPLGNETKKFTGTLDGCGYTISELNVSMTASTATYAGLFGAIDKDGTVKNLGVTGSVTVTTTSDYAYAYAGGIAGESAGKITNCYTNVTVSATSKSFIYAGGIVGYLANTAAATGTGTNTVVAGGILGSTYNKGSISYCFATGTIEAKGATSFKYAGGIAGHSGTVMTGCIALNKGITGASGTTNRIAGNYYEGSYANCYASPAIPGTWNETGATKKDGADLTSANFINSNDAFTGWVPTSWTSGDNWQFEANDFTNLPTLLTTGPTPEDIVLKGQTAIKRADCLGLVLIDKAVTYDANLHKDKNLVITSSGTLTVSAAGAQVNSLEIQPGGQVINTAELGVTKAMSTTRTLENKWITFGAPVDMTLLAVQGTHILNGYATSAAADQLWTSPGTLPSSPISSPCLLASDGASTTASFSSVAGTPIPVSAKAESGSALSNGIFLFRTNPSLSNQTVTNVYILSDDGTRFERQATYTLKPFECYMTANAVTTKAVMSLLTGNGNPTGNTPIALPDDTFRVWGANGQLHLSADMPHDVTVYSLSGKLLHSFRLEGSRTLAIGRGIYLVRSNNITYKVSL